jgi:tetratricopeptide (TPR) repeat protein
MCVIARSVLLAFLVSTGIAACSAVGVVATDDPYAKLAQAEVLLNEQGRVAQARRHLDEAIVMLEQRNDRRGLAQAYRQYGLVARAGGTNADPVIVRRTPAQPRAEELDASDRYLNRAADLAAETDQLHLRANIMLLFGANQHARGDRREACAFYDRALVQWREAEARSPGRTVQMPAQFARFDDGVAHFRQTTGCT